jgi:hypothetical protein
MVLLMLMHRPRDESPAPKRPSSERLQRAPCLVRRRSTRVWLGWSSIEHARVRCERVMMIAATADDGRKDRDARAMLAGWLRIYSR